MLPTDWKPPRSRLRQLSWLLALLLAVVAWRVAPSSISLPLRLAGAGVFAAGTLWPNLFYGLYLVLAVALYPVAWLGSQVLGRPLFVSGRFEIGRHVSPGRTLSLNDRSRSGPGRKGRGQRKPDKESDCGTAR